MMSARGSAHHVTVIVALAATLSLDATSQQRPGFSSSADAVLVDVLVSDRDLPVQSLKATDFVVRDNGVVQQVELLDTKDIPQNLFLVLDTGSDTTVEAFAGFARGVGRVLQKLPPRDRVALLSFSHRARLLSPLTADRSAVLQRFTTDRPDRYSAVADALYATTLLSRGEPGRSIAIVFTQGEDSASWLGPSDVLEVARRSNALVYGVTLHRLAEMKLKGFVSRPDSEGVVRRQYLTRSSMQRAPMNPSSVLHMVADATGGRVIYGDTAVPVETLLSDILGEFRERYIVAFRPIGRSPGWHDLSVSVTSKRATVAARKGYFVPR